MCVGARALSLDPARALDPCLKREPCNGRGAAGRKYSFRALFPLFCGYLFNKSQQKAADCPAIEKQAVVVGLWVSICGVYTCNISLLVILFVLCVLSNSPSPSVFHVHHRWGNCRESCTKLPFLSFLLKSHVTVGQKLFSLLEVRGR